MPNRQKAKGNGYEREINRDLEARGWRDCERAYGSNGRALGEVDECDNRAVSPLGNLTLRIQAKRRKSIAQYLYPPDGTDVVFVRENRMPSLAVLTMDRYLELLEAVDVAYNGDADDIKHALDRVRSRYAP